MCACGQPTINGDLGDRWQPDQPPGVRPVDPPALQPDDVLIYDEPGRCGGLDAHSHHYRVIKRGGQYWVLVRHGGGEEAIRWSGPGVKWLGPCKSTGRYWILHALYHAQADARRAGAEQMAARWRTAAAEKRIKVRKIRGSDRVRVTLL